MSRIDLEPQRQISILLRAKELTLDVSNSGLCYIMACAIRDKEFRIYTTVYSSPIRNMVKECIPLFTKENAIKYAGARTHNALFWWTPCDIESRLLFLDWIITELQKQIKHED